jgi:hypothetical protein
VPSVIPLYFVGKDATSPTVWTIIDNWSTKSGGAGNAAFYPGQTDNQGNTFDANFSSQSPANCALTVSLTVPDMQITGWHTLTISKSAILSLDDSVNTSTWSGNNTDMTAGTIQLKGGSKLKVGTGANAKTVTWAAGSIITPDASGTVEVVGGTLACSVTNLNDYKMPVLQVDKGAFFTLVPGATGDVFCPVLFTNFGTVALNAPTSIYVSTETPGDAGNEWPNTVANSGGAININPGANSSTSFYATIVTNSSGSVTVASGTAYLYGTQQPNHFTTQLSASFDNSSLFVTAGSTTDMVEYGITLVNSSNLTEKNAVGTHTAVMQGSQLVTLDFESSSQLNMANDANGFGIIDCTKNSDLVDVTFANSTYNCQFNPDTTTSNSFVCYKWTNNAGSTLNMVGQASQSMTWGSVIVTKGAGGGYPNAFSTQKVNSGMPGNGWTFPTDLTNGQSAKYSTS